MKEKQEAFHQKLAQFLREQNPELLQEWEEIQELQKIPSRIEEINHRIEESLVNIRNVGLAPLWRAFEDIQRFPQEEELMRQGEALERFINEVDAKIEAFKEELEGEDPTKLKYWKKKWTTISTQPEGNVEQEKGT